VLVEITSRKISLYGSNLDNLKTCNSFIFRGDLLWQTITNGFKQKQSTDPTVNQDRQSMACLTIDNEDFTLQFEPQKFPHFIS